MVYIQFVKFLSGHFSTLACHLLLIRLESYMISFKKQILRKIWWGWCDQLNRGDRGGQVYSLWGLICLRDTFFILSILKVVELMVRKCCLYKNITEKPLSWFPYPSLLWDLDEKIGKWPDLTDKPDIFCQKGNVSFTWGWHLDICLFLSPRVLPSQLLGGKHPGRGIYFIFFVLFSLVINTKCACKNKIKFR